MSKKKFEPGIYLHSKSKKQYYALAWGKSSENPEEEFVVYIPMYKRKVTDPPVWIRPLKMFTEKVRIGDRLVPRFILMKPISLLEVVENVAELMLSERKIEIK